MTIGALITFEAVSSIVVVTFFSAIVGGCEHSSFFFFSHFVDGFTFESYKFFVGFLIDFFFFFGADLSFFALVHLINISFYYYSADYLILKCNSLILYPLVEIQYFRNPMLEDLFWII